MGPNQLGTWNKVPEPSECGTYKSGDTPAGSKGSKGTSYVAAQNLSSSTGKDYSDKMANNTSDQTTQGVKGANVKAMASTTPGSESMGSDATMWGGRGVGGY